MDNIEKTARLENIDKQINKFMDDMIASAIAEKTPPEEIAMMDKVVRPFMVVVEKGDVLSTGAEMMVDAVCSSIGNMVAHAANKYARRDHNAIIELANVLLSEIAKSTEASLLFHFNTEDKPDAAMFSRPDKVKH